MISKIVIIELPWSTGLGIGVWNLFSLDIFTFLFFSFSTLSFLQQAKDFTKGCTPLHIVPTALFRCEHGGHLCECLNGSCTLGGCVHTSQPSWSLLSIRWTPHLGSGMLVWPLPLGHCDGFLRKQRACLVTGWDLALGYGSIGKEQKPALWLTEDPRQKERDAVRAERGQVSCKPPHVWAFSFSVFLESTWWRIMVKRVLSASRFSREAIQH